MLKMIINRMKLLKFIRNNVKIGSGTKILTSWFNFGSEPFLVEIGDNCLITSGVKFLTHDGSVSVIYKYFMDKNLEDVYAKYNKFGKIKVGNNVFIGVNSIIMPGVTIGNNVIIGAGSVVTKDVPDNVICAGNPAKVMCILDDIYDKVMGNITEINVRGLELRKSIITKALNKCVE